jgi:hypothetical protein
MPDPSDLSRERPEGPEEDTLAPQGLRRRVLARVRSEPEPVASGARDAAGRFLDRRGRKTALAMLLAGSACAIVLAVILTNDGSGTLGRTLLAQGLGSAHASLHNVDGHAELRLEGMPQPPIGEVYEVWLARPGSEPRPTNALFNVTSAGTAAVEVPGSLRGVSRVTVTAEPVGGSSHPTSPVVLTVALAEAR